AGKISRDSIVTFIHGEREAFISTGNGKAFTAAGLGNAFREWMRQAALPEKLSLHGLRKATGRRLAEAGCTPHQIMAILGHKSLSEAERYTKAFARKQASREATAKVVAMFGRKG
ncbi:MAG: tyrosine-type recombinase/integrase, partial [Methylocystis sp.]